MAVGNNETLELTRKILVQRQDFTGQITLHVRRGVIQHLEVAEKVDAPWKARENGREGAGGP